MQNPHPAPLLIAQICSEGQAIIDQCHKISDASGEISSELGSDREYLGHILDLVQKHSIGFRFEAGPLSSLHCASRLGPPRVWIPWPIGPFTYFTALHEIGHAVLHQKPGNTAEETLIEEIEAWDWAFSTGEILPNLSVLVYADTLLDQYRHMCKCTICGSRKEIRYEDDPQTYEDLKQRLDAGLL